MWILITLENGLWVDKKSFNTIEECESSQKSATGISYIFYDGEFPADIQEQNLLLEKINDVNDNPISMVTVGLDLSTSKKDVHASTCSGDCYCVIANGSRRCETKYCSGSWCWWVPCGSSC